MQYYTDSSSYSSSNSSVGSFLRQLSNSSKDPYRGYSASKRWSSYSMRKQQRTDDHHHQPPPMEMNSSYSSNYVEGLNKLYYHHHQQQQHDHDHDHYNYVVKKKRVMVVVDSTNRSKQAMMWALTHVSNKGDLLTLLHIIPTPNTRSSSSINGGGSSSLAASLASLCKACKPEVEIEGLVIEGPKLVGTVLSQVKKLDVSVLVLGQKKPSPFSCLFQCGGGGSRNDGLGDEFVEECIKSAECLALGVRKQSKSVGGYLISTRWQKNFWLLA